MVLLINKTKVSEILQVAIGYNENEFNVFIREAQYFDLKPMLCEKFYFELIEKRSDSGAWQKIINGGPYNHEQSQYHTRGIADVLAYFTYARFIRESNNVSTSHGFVNKTSSQLLPLSTEEKNNMHYKYQKDAYIIFSDVKKFIERNISNYASWNDCSDNCNDVKSSILKTRVIQ